MLRDRQNSPAISHLSMRRQLGSGAYGVVYEAVDERTGGAVAVKELRDASPGAVARFKKEFRVLADLRHPNLVGLKELIEHEGRWFIVMELVPGTDFLKHVRVADNDNGFDEERLRSALADMTEGLRALHGYGVLHRDLKPSNVKVRPDGRAVLLDFGLATGFAPGEQSVHGLPVGTVSYMAPEQAAGRALTPAADLYALGVCLFEGLTGFPPFSAPNAYQVLFEKQHQAPPRASSLAQVPADLDALCAALLETDPLRRPSAEHVSTTLRRERRRVPRALLPRRDLFVGRDAELTLLERALTRSQQGDLRVVLIEGESGVGKSELAQEFVRQKTLADPKLVVLRGRCYENEQVSYKVFDGCVDELARVLGSLPTEACSALMPPNAGLLGQLFPVLREVRSIAWARAESSSADPTARRLEAFSAFAALLANLAAASPLVLVVDDLQWADPESFRLLHAVTSRQPSPALLVVCTVRPRSELEPDVLPPIAHLRASQHTEVLPLVGLPGAQARALAGPLLGSDAPARALEMVAEESQGHPLFMSELAEYARRHNYGPHLRITLETALHARVERLRPPERALLELVALAARPYPVNVFARALGVDTLEEPARALIGAKLLRERRGHELGCFHDRIRHAATSLIASARLTLLHRQLAEALEGAQGVDPAEQARHWELAGEREHALEAYGRAVTQATDALAFQRAAQLAARALELLGASRSDERAHGLMVQRAYALRCAGYAAESAALYERAAERSTGDERLRLRANAASALLISSNVARGLKLAGEVMRELGLRVPSTLLGIVLRHLWDTALLRFQLMFKRARAAVVGDGASRERMVLELTSELLVGVSTVHPMLLPATVSQQGRLALRVGSRAELACVYAGLGWIAAVTRSRTAAEPLFDASRRLIRSATDPLAIATRAYTEGSARLAVFDVEGARPCLELASATCQQHLPSRPFLLTSVRYHLGILWFEAAEFWRIAREMDGWIEEARARNDVQAVALLVGHGRGFLRHLMRDDPAEAHAELDEAMRAIPNEPFAFTHIGYAWSKVLTYAYARDAEAALKFFAAFEEQHRDAFLMRSRMGRRVRVLIRAYALMQSLRGETPEQKPERDRQRKRALRQLRRIRTPYARGLWLVFSAEEALRAGDRERAHKLARAARPLLERRDRASAYGAFVGLLEGGAGGRAQYEAALLDSRQQGFQRPEAAVGMAVAGIELLLNDAPGEHDPQRFDARYEVVAQLAGGFGDTVAARHVQTGRPVAIKEFVPGGRTSLERFKQQYRALSRLHHPNLVQLESLFESRGRWYITMERVEGKRLLDHVRSDGACDDARLRTCFAGLARALRALHAAGFVHRDVTPEHVRVTAEGRTVLVDFGRVAGVDEGTDHTRTGSPLYAAPEQLRGAAPDPSADVYALGVCLHEALVGTHPFGEGELPEVLLRKERGDTSTLHAAHDPLGPLCARMLSAEPTARPSIDEVLYLLERQPSPSGAIPVAQPLPGESPRDDMFVGRAEELDALAAASERSCDEGLLVALVEGESGVGKSALAHAFARRAAAGTPALWVLSGRCYEAEQIALKAFDGAVDTLAAQLRALPATASEEVMPPNAALLAQLFPVLHSVPAIARAPKKGLPADPAARKAAGRSAFATLLERLCDKTELLLLIDDLQWADLDSFALLDVLVARAASLPILLVATVRPPGELAPDVRARLDALRATGRTVALPLAPLAEPDAQSLAAALLEPGARVAATLARESGGHPLFLRELVEHVRQGLGDVDTHRGTLQSALRARIERLAPDARHLLSLVALSDKPYGLHVYARAMGMPELPRDALITLLQQGLLRRRAGDALALTHHHVQKVARTLVDGPARAPNARALAEALDGEPGVDPAECAELWEQAGAVERAIAAYTEAGDRAIDGLAFARAEQHFARALVLLGDARDERAWRLLAARGTALARAGRSADAARAYACAAETAEGEQLVRLRILEARHLIQSAQVDKGLAAATALLRKLHIAVPETQRASLVRIAWERARTRMQRPASLTRALSPAEQLQLDALEGLSAPLSLASYLTGFTVMAQYLRHALRSGESDHAARALAYEGLWRSMRRPEHDQAALFERARELAEQAGEPAVRAQVDQLRGLSFLGRTDYARAVPHLERAHEVLSTRCAGEAWLLTTTRMHLGLALWASGDFVQLRNRARAWLEEARARDDRCAIAALCGFGGASFRHLVEGDVSAARAELAEVVRDWPSSPFTLIHWGVFVARHTLLTVSPGGPALRDALQQLEREQPHSYLLRAPTVEAARLSGRCGVLLRAIAGAPSPDELAAVHVSLRALQRIRAPLSRSAGRWFEALLDALEGRREKARALFEDVLANRGRTALFGGQGAAYALGLLEGGAAGIARRDEVLAQLAREGFRAPRIGLLVRAPAIDVLERVLASPEPALQRER